jgi:hypothetical protein
LSKNQPAYSLYKELIPEYLYATRIQKNVPVSGGNYPINFDGLLLPIEDPPVVVSWSKPIPHDSTIMLSQIQSEMVDIQGYRCHSLPKPTIDALRVFVRDGVDTKCRVYRDHVNIDALRQLKLVQMIFSAFLHMHGYPGYSTMDDSDEVVEFMRKSDQPSSSGTKRARVEVAKDTSEVLEEKVESACEDDDNQRKIGAPKAEDFLIRWAKPQRQNDNPWGNSNSLPNSSGMFVPFVLGLESPDPDMVPLFVSRFLIRGLGSDINQCFQQLREIQGAFGTIAKTLAGHIYAHLAKCMYIGLEAQCQIFPVFDEDIYQGCVLSGSHFVIDFDKEVYGPTAYENLQVLVSENSLHTGSLKRISDLVGVEALKDCKSMRQISKILLATPIRPQDIEEIKEMAKRIFFPKIQYWPINPKTLKDFFTSISQYNTVQDIDNEIPLHPDMLFSEDVGHSMLAAFGYMVPNFNIPSCPSFELTTTCPCPPHFVVARSVITYACENLDKIRTSKFVSNNPRNISKVHKDYLIPTKDAPDIWSLLIDFVGPPLEVDLSSFPVPVAKPVKESLRLLF